MVHSVYKKEKAWLREGSGLDPCLGRVLSLSLPPLSEISAEKSKCRDKGLQISSGSAVIAVPVSGLDWGNY